MGFARQIASASLRREGVVQFFVALRASLRVKFRMEFRAETRRSEAEALQRRREAEAMQAFFLPSRRSAAEAM